MLLIRQGNLVLSAPSDEQFLLGLRKSPLDLPEAIAKRIGAVDADVRALSSKLLPLWSNLWQALSPTYARWHVFDIGAYIGSVGLAIGSWAKQQGLKERMRIDIFEPASTFDNIQTSAEWNDLADAVELHHCALSDAVGTAQYHCAGGLSIGGRLGAFAGSALIGEVRTVSVDSVVDTVTFSADLYFLKIDTEGFEREVLRGATRTLKRPNILALEFHAKLLGSDFGKGAYEDFLWRNYHLCNIKHIDYPLEFEMLEEGNLDQLRKASFRSKDNSMTDLLCIDKRIDIGLVAGILHEA